MAAAAAVAAAAVLLLALCHTASAVAATAQSSAHLRHLLGSLPACLPGDCVFAGTATATASNLSRSFVWLFTAAGIYKRPPRDLIDIESPLL